MVTRSSLRCIAYIATCLALGLITVRLPAHALVLMDVYTINHAIRYGAIKQNSGYQGLLASNWVMGDNGALLNVYTPYMMLAAKAMRLGLPTELTELQLKDARSRLGKELRYLNDPKQTKTTKLMVSLLGPTATFHTGVKASLVGRGRGRDYSVTPVKVLLPAKATPLKTGASQQASHEVVLSFYVKLEDQLKLEGPYQLRLTWPDGREPMVFNLNNDTLY
jgi:hypothetical protein